MHLLAATPGLVLDADAPVDLGQSPAEIVFLSAADSEIAGLARARAKLADPPSLRLANLLALKHPYAVDLYVEKTLAQAKLIVVRLLGGRGYWSYGVDRLVETARKTGAVLALLPGDDKPDSDLAELLAACQQRRRSLSPNCSWRISSKAGPPTTRARSKRFMADLAASRTRDRALPPVPDPARRAAMRMPTRGPARRSSPWLFYRAHYPGGRSGPRSTR
jgi:cobaltochelatase CobN